MAKVGAQRAAELTGKSKSTIQRAMNSGKISYELDSNGRRVVDVSELERAFGLEQQEKPESSSSVERELEKASTMLEMERMKMRIQMLETQLENAETRIEELQGQRDQWQKQAAQVLITSQHSQKEALRLRKEIKIREQRAREKRERRIAQQMQKLRGENENSAEEESSKGLFSGMWGRTKKAS